MTFCCRIFFALVAITIGLCPHSAEADILLPKIFCDHMVLQRRSAVPMNGTAEPGQELKITFQEQEISVTADDSGNWSAQLLTGEAGGPYEISIVAVNQDTRIVINDVLVGDVWLCSGQSNMARPVSMALNAELEIEQSKKYSNLRLFSVKKSVALAPEAEFAKVEPWQVCSPDSVKNFSATGYFFGREIANRIDTVPIGLVSSAVGGTPCESWLSRKKMEGIDSLKPLLDHWEQNEEINSTHRPANLYNGMIAPLGEFPIRGIIWYQGEANVGRAAQYKHLFPALIEDWRQTFDQPDLPFLFAQLAPFRYQRGGPDSLPELWEAQLQTLKSVPETGMAVLTDIGNLEDIHPNNKQDVGRRLALLAIEKCYSEETENQSLGPDFYGPIFETATVEDGVFQIKFTGCQSGLKVAGESESVSGFTICGENQDFVPASAQIVDNVVIVKSGDVPDPTAVRYGWDPEMPMNLVNGNGLPASPFRTDEFPFTSSSADF